MKQFTNLGLKDRKRIEILLAKNLLVGVIAKQLGFHRSTIAREIHRNSPQGNSYSANFAEKRMKKRNPSKDSPWTGLIYKISIFVDSDLNLDLNLA